MSTIEQLCDRHGNENVHTEHVAALAVQLFDATHRWLGLPHPERRLLAAAARLHDVGYCADPVHHTEQSADIVLHEGIEGFSLAQRQLIAAIIPAHNGRLDNIIDQPHRVLALGAFLRVADGLDHGHVQDAAIMKVTRKERSIRVTVRSPHFPFNLTKADRKADLWRAVFPLDIQFILAPGPVAPLIRADTPASEAARRLMSLQFKTMTINLDAAVAGTGSEPLHDVRVAIRRLRVLLRTFRKQIPKSSRKNIDAALGQLNRDLGPTRDMDVWVDALESDAVRRALARSRLWPAYIEHHRQRRKLRQTTVRRCLRGAHFAALRGRIARLLRAELPALAKSDPASNLPVFALKKIRKSLRQAMKLAPLRRSDSPAEMHRLRIALRKARYLGEFFEPVLDPTMQTRLRHVRAVEQSLGKLHDTDAGLARAQHEGPLPPRALTALLQDRRRQQVKRLNNAWLQLRKRK